MTEDKTQSDIGLLTFLRIFFPDFQAMEALTAIDAKCFAVMRLDNQCYIFAQIYNMFFTTTTNNIKQHLQ